MRVGPSTASEVAAGWCVNDDYVCRWRVGVLIDICSSILHGDFSARLQQRALQALGWVAIAGRVDWADLRRIVLLCGQAAGRPHIAKEVGARTSCITDSSSSFGPKCRTELPLTYRVLQRMASQPVGRAFFV